MEAEIDGNEADEETNVHAAGGCRDRVHVHDDVQNATAGGRR